MTLEVSGEFVAEAGHAPHVLKGLRGTEILQSLLDPLGPYHPALLPQTLLAPAQICEPGIIKVHLQRRSSPRSINQPGSQNTPPVQTILGVLTQEGEPGTQRVLRRAAEHAISDVRFLSRTQGATWVRPARLPPVVGTAKPR